MSLRNIYVGRISDRTKERDLEDIFAKYGKVNSVSLKVGYGFVEMDDSRDAEDAVKALDGYDLDGAKIVVEHSRGRRDDRREDPSRRGRRAGPPVRTNYRVIVEELSSSCNWRDLKDLMRTVGSQPTFADVYRDGTGVIEFESYDDMKRAVSKLDDTKFQGRRIYLKEDKERGKDRYEPYSRRSRRSHSGSRSRSPRRRSGSRSNSPRKRSPSPRKKSPSPRKRSPSPRKGSKSKSRSPSPKKRSPSSGRKSGSLSPTNGH